MQRVGIPSWRIGFGPSFILNPALFIREACGLSNRHDPWRAKPPWPPAHLTDRLSPDERAAAAGDWPAWWETLVELACALASQGPGSQTIRGPGFDPPAFDSLDDRPALRRACQVAWEPYSHWWHMPAGGNLAIESWFRVFGVGDTIQRVVRNFENRHLRRARPFSLHIDLVYAQTRDVRLVGDHYAVMAAGWFLPHRAFEGWLAERVEALA